MYRRFLILLLPLLLSVTATAKSLTPVTLQLSWKYQFEFAGYIAAKEKGYYEQAGLDVRLKEFQTGTSVVDEVVNGGADFGIYDADITLLADQGSPVVWLQNYLKRPALVLAVKPNIFTPKDLVGKKVMATKEELEQSSVGLMLKQFNIAPEQFERVDHTYTTDAFEKGDVDAMVVYLSNEPYHLQEKRVIYNLLDPVAYGIHAYSGNLFTSRSKLAMEEAVVRKFMDATVRGWHYALTHKEEMVSLIYSKYTKRKRPEALRYEAETIERLIMPDFYPLGSLSHTQIYRNAAFLSQSGLITVAKIDDYIYSPDPHSMFSSDEKAYLASKKVIRMCVDPDWMPFEKLENGRHIGMTADYFRLFAKSIGTPIEAVQVKSWSDAMAKAKARECDIYSLAMETPERKTYMDFTTPYLNIPLVVATTNEKLFISDVNTLEDKKIGVVKEYAFGEILRQRYPKMEMIDVDTVHDGLQKVANGELYGFIDSLVTIGYQIQKSFPGELKITGKFDEMFELGIGTRNDEPLLQSIFEKAITQIGQEAHQEILNRWIAVSYEEHIDYRIIWQIIMASVMIAAGLAWIIALQRRKNVMLKRTKAEVNELLDSFIALFNSTLEAIIIMQDGKIIEANEAMSELFGYEKEEIVGHSPLEFVDEAYHAILVENMKKERVKPYEIEALNKEKERISVLVRGQNAKFRGEDVRIAAIVDIRMQKSQQRSLEIINEKLNELATHDQLTGLANRRMLEETAAQEIERHRRYGGELSMMMLDIDFFKQVNDTFGHLTGDYVLKEISRLIERHSRMEDLAGRWGGEEFIILMPQTDLSEAHRLAERLREKIHQHAFKDIGRLTISIGLAQYDDSKGKDIWFTEADDCLYQAKAQGRNRVVSEY